MSSRRRVSCILLAVLLAGTSLRAQDEAVRDTGPVLAKWRVLLAQAKDAGPAPQTAEERKAFFRRLVEALYDSPEGRAFRVIGDEERKAYLSARSAAAANESVLARSSNAAATNPRRVGLLERSGIVDLISTAVQGTNLLAADDRAVTLNLSAAALLCRRCRDEAVAAAARYRAGGGLNRLGGSLTFGEKIPEKQITGFSGLPDTGKLFDAWVWDVKLRVRGDRDPRAERWDDVILGDLGGRTVLGAMMMADPNLTDDEIQGLKAALEELALRRTPDVLRAIRSSLQVSVKFSGQNLRKQAGMNKYTGVLMVDKGFGSFDGSLNVSYSALQDVTIVKDVPVTLKQWKATAGFVGSVLKDKIVANRSATLTLSGEGLFPVDGDEVPLDRKITYKADVAIKLPISATLELPLSVTYTNDPNELAKKNYVSGRIGITYDFGALKRLASGK